MKQTMMVMMIALVAMSAGAWEILNDEDLMTGETILIGYVEADEYQGARQPPWLIMRSTGEIYVEWGGDKVPWSTVRIVVRIGDSEPKLYPIAISKTREATFITVPEIFVEEARGQSVIAVGSRTATGREMVAQFEISGIAEVWQSLTQER